MADTNVFSMTLDTSDMEKNLKVSEEKFDKAVRMYAETGAVEFQNFAKDNRPWTDRTGHARQTLHGYVGKSAKGYRIYLSHGVFYGIFLELCHEKRFSIIPRTIQYVGTNVIMPGFKHMMGRMSNR